MTDWTKDIAAGLCWLAFIITVPVILSAILEAFA